MPIWGPDPTPIDTFSLGRSAMSKFNVQKYALLCLRLAAECRGLAADVPEPDLRVHFLRMASIWTELADQPRILH
jgi:hypothetical protein